MEGLYSHTGDTALSHLGSQGVGKILSLKLQTGEFSQGNLLSQGKKNLYIDFENRILSNNFMREFSKKSAFWH